MDVYCTNGKSYKEMIQLEVLKLKCDKWDQLSRMSKLLRWSHGYIIKKRIIYVTVMSQTQLL